MTKEEVLNKKGITYKTKFHVYDYLYKSILEAMEDHAISFAKWYSGMDKEKVERAYERYLVEQSNQEGE